MLRRWQLHRNYVRISRTRAQETLRSHVRCRERKDSPFALRNHCNGAQWQEGISCEVGQRLSAPVHQCHRQLLNHPFTQRSLDSISLHINERFEQRVQWVTPLNKKLTQAQLVSYFGTIHCASEYYPRCPYAPLHRAALLSHAIVYHPGPFSVDPELSALL